MGRSLRLLLVVVASGMLTNCVACSALAQTGSSAFSNDRLARVMRQHRVEVSPSLRSRVDVNALRRLVASGTPAARIAVVASLPESGRQFGTRDGYTRALHDYLGMGNGILVIETRKGVSAISSDLRPADVHAILVQNLSQLQSDPLAGMQAILPALRHAALHPGTAAKSATALPAVAPAAPAPQPEAGGTFLWVVLALLGLLILAAAVQLV